MMRDFQKSLPSRYLVTTADERTWPSSDEPILFLGEWCCRYDRRAIWSKLDGTMALAYGLEPGQKDKDHEFSRRIEKKVITILKDELNYLYGQDHSERYWLIVLGHWLRSYIQVLVNRYNHLQACFSSNLISGTTAFKTTLSELAAPTSWSFYWDCSSDHWNNALYVAIMDYLDFPKPSIQYYHLENTESDNDDCGQNNARSRNRTLKKYLRATYNTLSAFLVRKQDAFIVNTYLPRFEELKLQLLLGQMPQLWMSPELETAALNLQLRDRLTQKILTTNSQGVERCILGLLFQVLPICYLEGYQGIGKQLEKLKWPTSPRFIFTSNNFFADEVFKRWTAAAVERGVPYFVGQHGNNYGTSKALKDSIEEVTSDRFFSWGWTEGLSQHIPAFIFKTANQKVRKKVSGEQLFLISLPLPHRMLTWDIYPEHTTYQEDQFQFVDSLSMAIKKKLVVRLHGDHKKNSWCEAERWSVRCPFVNLEDTSASFLDILEKSRLLVFSYDSTGILEALSLNVPVIAFWNDELEHLRESAIPFYQLLYDVGIIHFSPESAACKINEVWDNAAVWWGSREVQNARQLFCQRYARVVDKPLRTIKKMLKPSFCTKQTEGVVSIVAE